ncbi:MAG: TolC family protein [Bacteroidetes bacterium]|nr:TolC family protein [Bacteroidota bacterium]
MHRPLLNIWILALIFSLSPCHALPQKKTIRMSLEEATALAKERSIQALIAKQQFQVSFWDYKTFRGAYLPQLTAGGAIPDFNRSINAYTTSEGTKIYQLQQYVNYGANLSLSQQIGFTGGNISLNSGLTRTDNLGDSTFTSYVSTPINIKYTQPIFKFNSYRWDRKIKPLQYDLAKRKYLEDMEDVNMAATNLFFALLRAQVEKKIAQTNYVNYDTLYKISHGRFQVGKIPQNQLLQYELQLLTAKLSIENADLSLEDALFSFKSYLRIQNSDSIILEPPVNITFFTVNPVKAIEEASVNSSASGDFSRRLLEADMGVNMAKMDGRFDADLSAVFGYNQTAAKLPDAYKNPQDLEQVTLQLNVPILDWGVARGKIKMAEFKREITKSQVEQEMIDFKQNVYREVMKFNIQKNQLTIAAKADTVAKLSYKITQDRYMIGKISDFQELYQAQTAADNSENAFFSALLTYWQRYYGLRKMTLYDFEKKQQLQFNFQDVKP